MTFSVFAQKMYTFADIWLHNLGRLNKIIMRNLPYLSLTLKKNLENLPDTNMGDILIFDNSGFVLKPRQEIHDKAIFIC